MKKKVMLLLIVILGLITITGCGNKSKSSTKSSNKVYICKNNDNSDGKRYLTTYTIELNSKGKAIKYSIKDGFGNYEDNIEGFNNYCDGLKKGKENNKEKIEKYKDAATMEVICDTKKMEAYYIMSYDLAKIKNIDDFKNINNEIAKYTKDDKTFDLDAWKNYFATAENKSGHYDCNF